MRTTAYIIAAGISAMALTSCGKVIKIHTAKERITKEIQAEQAFNAIESYGTTDIVYVDGPAKITLKAGKNQIDDISVFVKDSVLVVTGPEQSGNYIFRGDTESKLTVSYPGVRSFNTYGTGDMEITPADGLSLVLNSLGTGDIEAKRINCTRLFAQTSGTGDISLGNVTCTDAELYTQGTGDIDISDISAGNIKADT
ncbi:MAG: DUF2807 domain-containing protein, partial [Muribaculaceae bacterium]|nr:DUF2807 domain-containing protein [Muribaculaceae bacterium]